MAIKVTPRTANASRWLALFARRFDPRGIDMVVERVAMKTWTALVSRTPPPSFRPTVFQALPTGMTRRGWLAHPSGQGWQVTNSSRTMLFLEDGTRAHGPVRARMLFLPLTRAAQYGWHPGLVYGRDYILRRRVAGIAAMHITRDQRPLTQRMLQADMLRYCFAATRSP